MNYWPRIIDSLSQIKFSDFINLFTLFLLFWTANEGYRSRISSNEANEFKLLPFITIYLDTKDFNNMKCFIQNLGEGVAFDIQIISWQLIFKDAQEILELNLRLTDTNVLGTGERRELEVRAYKNGKVSNTRDFLIYAIAPRRNIDLQEGFQAAFTVKFKNARSVRYLTKIITGPKGINILEPPQKITFLINLKLFWEFKIHPTIYFYKLIWLFRKPYIEMRKK